MGLDQYSTKYDQEDLEKFSKQLLDRYGVFPCEEAKKLEKTNLTEGSLSSYKPQVRSIIKEVGESDPPIGEVIEVIETSDKEPSTKSVMVSAMKKYYTALAEDAKAEEFHAEAKRSNIDKDAFSGSMEVEEWLTVDEVEKVIEYILPDNDEESNMVEGVKRSWKFELEHKAMFETLYYTGCRVAEVAMLQVSDFDLENNQVQVYRLKKGGDDVKRDMIAIPSEFVETIEAYIESKGIEGGDLFNYTKRTIQNRITDIDDAAQFVFDGFKHTDKLTPHKLRHARVTAIANDSSLDKAGEFVDHASVDTTKAYRHIAVEDQRDMLPEENDDDDMVKALAEKLDVDEEEIADVVQSISD